MFSHGVVSLFSVYEFDCPSGIFRPSFISSRLRHVLFNDVKHHFDQGSITETRVETRQTTNITDNLCQLRFEWNQCLHKDVFTV